MSRWQAPLEAWFATQGWKPAPFQRAAWRAYRNGEDGLIVTPTGSGKTLAAFGGPLLRGLHEAAVQNADPARTPTGKRSTSARRKPEHRTRVLWITPLRSLAADTAHSLQAAIEGVGIDWIVAVRTGDATSRDRRLARQGRADVVVITPESLALQLSYPDAVDALRHVDTVIVDEWHELLANKRGVLLQLCLARLRQWHPDLQTWGLSATLGNIGQAREVLLPHAPEAPIIAAAKPRRLDIETLLPGEGRRFPAAGHLGLSQLAQVHRRVAEVRSSIVFTNTRAQAELWHKALESSWLGEPSELRVHHGSLDKTLRHDTEAALKAGTVRCVVATSSLDLGVDFPAVDQVFQIGSPKGIARLLQRGGRARHRPGESGKVIGVPTHGLEVAEYAAVREALRHGRIESRQPLRLSLDVLAQHCVTMALGGGFQPDALRREIETTHAFHGISDAQWTAVLDFIVRGGGALEHYPEYRKVQVVDGRFVVEERKVAIRHRLSIGTITGDGQLSVKLLKGGHLGSVEESFLSRLRPREVFQFAGRSLELVRLEGMTAHVRLAKGASSNVPRWQGGRMPMSTELADELERVLARPPDSPEMRASRPLLATQARLSVVPEPGILLVEQHRTREGWHLAVFPFAGRAVHEGLAAIFGLRLGRMAPNTYSFSVNDYGLILSSTKAFAVDQAMVAQLLDGASLSSDLMDSLNLAEMARRQFREIARVSGLLPPSLPGRNPRSMRQLQASAGLLFDVLQRHDPDHVLLHLATREVLEQQLDFQMLAQTLERCRRRRIVLTAPENLTPFAFPLWAEFVRGNVSTEDWKARVQRAVDRLERAYG